MVWVIGLLSREAVDVDAQADGWPLAALYDGDCAGIATLERLEDALIDTSTTRSFVGMGQFGITRDGHALVGREGVRANVEFGEVVTESRLEFGDDACGRVEFSPGGFRACV